MSATVLEQLARISAAEEFFALLDVGYEPQVLNVARLHILRRMRQYMSGFALDGLADGEARGLLREQLSRAYADFVASSPIEQRVFKVHQDAVRPASPRGFVPLSAIMGG